MKSSAMFNDVLEAIDSLSLEEQEDIASLLGQRLVEYRRNRLASDIQDAAREFQEGRCAPATPAEIMDEIIP